MPQIDKKIAAQVLDTLDSTGNEVERLMKAGFLDPKVAGELIHHIDSSADRIQVAAFGPNGLEAYKAKMAKVAKVIKQDSDEPYMKTFENVNAPEKVEADEPYMHKTEPSFNSKSIPTFDQDASATVSERNEYDVRDLSEWTDKTTKQPSWPGGSSGKSTKQGSERRASAPKTWAP
jgi:hypothetical protein